MREQQASHNLNKSGLNQSFCWVFPSCLDVGVDRAGPESRYRQRPDLQAPFPPHKSIPTPHGCTLRAAEQTAHCFWYSPEGEKVILRQKTF